ncbi:MAG: polysaccharide pyruvyl transferase family protein, partial [Chloroflexi bacterium]|nr:polysaccharide pyruvyl transferase family protein [Chloroflexota bacterium]
METSPKSQVLLLDYCSEKNRGDAAMQVGLIRLVQKYFHHSDISAVTVFGANQTQGFYKEYDHTLKMSVTLLGGLKPTFFPLGDNETRLEFFIELMNLVFLAFSSIVLLLLALKLPTPIIAHFLPAEFRKTLYAIRDADVVIWNGRNFRSRENWLLEAYRTFNVIYHPLLCKLLSKPMVCVGASLWNLNSPLSKRLLRSVFEYCTFISFREPYSYKAAQTLLDPQREGHIRLLP